MANESLLQRLNDIENTFPVDQLFYRSTAIWPLIRNTAHSHSFRDRKINRKINKFSTFPLSRLNAGLIKLFLSFRSSCALMYMMFYEKKSKNIFIGNNNLRLKLSSGASYSRLYDSLCDLGLINSADMICLEKGVNYSKETNRKVLDYSFIFFVVSLLSVFLSRPFFHLYVDKKNKIILRKILVEVGIAERSLCRACFSLTILSYLFKKIATSFKSTDIYIVCWYSIEGMAWANAANQLSINSIDLQHGLAGANQHVSYTSWNKFFNNQLYKLIPSVFWCWSGEDKKSIDAWRLPETSLPKTLIIGDPWMNLISSNIENPVFVKKFLTHESFQFIESIKVKEEPIILYSMQYSTIPEFLLAFINSSTGRKYYWLIRKHPRFVDCDLNHSLPGNCESFFSSSIPIPFLFLHASIHFTGWSAVHLYAKNYNLQTIFLDKAAYSYFNDDIVSGQAKVLPSLEALENYFYNR